ncbi:hypothetical protein IMSHALPRED_004068 [Imshaugia aleurites]|uniref:Uncharacterized protein n=1 Tax=Imshaugia aleurites TaxID=172621 RepID=A0A8H3EKB5_9LECA|nr:hypothetical protein IMSHALPRED_004068 [Imshaugia aleurites]
MSLILKKAPGSPWNMTLKVPGPGLALTFHGERTEQEETHQQGVTKTEHTELERKNKIKKEYGDHVPSKDEQAEDAESAGDEGAIDGEVLAREDESEDGQGGSSYEEDDRGDDGENRGLENGEEERISALTVGITIDQET